MDEECDKSNAQLFDDKRRNALGTRCYCPTEDILEQLLCLVVAKVGTLFISVSLMLSVRGVATVPVFVQFDNNCQGRKEFDVVVWIRNQALCKLPALRGLLQSLKNLLDARDSLRGIRLIESYYQLSAQVSCVSLVVSSFNDCNPSL